MNNTCIQSLGHISATHSIYEGPWGWDVIVYIGKALFFFFGKIRGEKGKGRFFLASVIMVF